MSMCFEVRATGQTPVFFEIDTTLRTEGYHSGARCGGDYEVRLNLEADEDDRGGHLAWEVWNWRTGCVESDWFKASDAYRECLRLTQENHKPRTA